MMKNIKLFATLMVLAISAQLLMAQNYFSKTGEISFFSSTPIEDIEATSRSASTVFDMESGKIQWAVLIKSFEFEKALMQEHFNENYMESSKFPKAKFSGVIEDISSVDFNKDGTYTVPVSGTLEIHGVSNDITTEAQFVISKGAIEGSSTFKVLVADYGIEIPGVVRENIAKEIEIRVKADYELLEKS